MLCYQPVERVSAVPNPERLPCIGGPSSHEGSAPRRSPVKPLFALLLTLMAAFAQTPVAAPSRAVADAPPSFDVASVKPAPKQTGPGVYVNWSITPGRVNYENVTLTGILARMYSLQSYQLVGPVWLSSDGWDITARAKIGPPLRASAPVCARSPRSRGIRPPTPATRHRRRIRRHFKMPPYTRIQNCRSFPQMALAKVVSLM